MHQGSSSIQQAAWKRLKKNKGAVFGMIIILLAMLLAVVAYLVSPDSSPFANRMIVEIGGMKPGYQQKFLKVRKDKPVVKAGFFQRLLYGQEDAFTFIPVNAVYRKNGILYIDKYIDEGLSETLPVGEGGTVCYRKGSGWAPINTGGIS